MSSDAPSWRDLFGHAAPVAPGTISLALGVELRQRSGRDPVGWASRRVETATPRTLATSSGEVTLGLRPLMRSASTGRWVKGEVSWEVLRRYGHRYHPGQLRWLRELHSIVYDTRSVGVFPDASEWLTLDGVASSLLWPHLSAASDAGVDVVATAKGQQVRLAGSGATEIRVDEEASDLVLRARVRVGGASAELRTVHTIGRTGLYHWTVTRDGIALTLAPVPVDDALATLLTHPDGIRVPPAERDAFLRGGLPRLRRRTMVSVTDALTLPEPIPPRLELTVHFRPREVVDVSLAWSYGTGPSFAVDARDGGDHDLADDDERAPERDIEAEAALLARVREGWTNATTVPFASAGSLTGIEAAEFVAHAVPALERIDGVRVVIQGRPRAYTELTADPEIRVSTVESTDADWFDLGVIVTIEGRRIPFGPLFTALTQRRRQLLLSDGAYFRLDHPALERLRELIDEARSLAEWETAPRVSRYQTALWEDFEDLADHSEPARSWRALTEGLRAQQQVEPTALPPEVDAQLRPYQRAGFDWLAFLWRHRLGGILADDMGLGKTLQALAFIAHVRKAESRPVLVVAPTSMLATWRDEAGRFTPGLRVHVVDHTRARGGAAVDVRADVVVTSYTLLRLRAQELIDIRWAMVLLDEAQAVKNPATKAHQTVADLRSDAVYAVTGTPMENSLAELWALLSLTSPGLFPSARRFRQEYIGPIEKGKVPENQEGGAYRAARLARLRRRVRPFLLRRSKELVAAELPGKQEQVLSVELSSAHRAVYDTVLQRERQKVLGLLDDLDRNRFIVFRSLTLLRMLSLSASLIDPVHARIPAAKLDVLVEHISELAGEGHRSLVFSQFTSFLQQAGRRLEDAGIAHRYLDGSTRAREEVIDAFRTGDDAAFLISLKAGGVGLTLTEADYVFLLDPWWNPATENQAIDRTHRIGQRRSVFVYRMIAADTIEQKVLALQERKGRLFHTVMDEGDLFASTLTAEDVRALFEG